MVQYIMQKLAVKKSVHSKNKRQRDNGKPRVAKILFSAIWIHCPLILSDIL